MADRTLKVLGVIAAIGIVAFGAIQLIRPDIVGSNPPIVREAVWSSPEGEALARRACFDCHSNETVWPWYSRIAPVSWLIARDVAAGRAAMNFSDTHPDTDPPMPEREFMIRHGKMPPAQYLMMHPEARLTDTEKESLIAVLVALE